MTTRPLLLALSLAVPALLAGCAMPTTETTVVAGPGGASIEFDMPAGEFSDDSRPDASKPADDPEAPPVTLNGERAGAVSMLVRESSETRNGGREVRYPCGGAALAVPAGEPDPRAHLSELVYVESFELKDPQNRSWVTDRYGDVTDPGNLTRSVWVTNVGGAEGFLPDDGRGSCEPARHNGTEFNALVYPRELDGVVDVHFVGTARPMEPEARTWWTGPLPEPWTTDGAAPEAEVDADAGPEGELDVEE